MIEARIDLHVHTSCSEDRESIAFPNGASVTVPFHPILTPLEVYERALDRGMTMVTFTDHDTLDGCLELLEHHPNPRGFLTGEEITCYLRGIPFHLGVYGLTEADHATIHDGAERSDRETACLRWHPAELLDYLDSRHLPYDLKHPVWMRDDLVPPREHLTELLRRIPLVEAINGTRHPWLNRLGVSLAERLGRPAFTAGSDSHTDNVGRTYTRTWGATAAEVQASLLAGRCEPCGGDGTHWLLDHDVRACLGRNVNRRAGHMVTVADDFVRDLPLILRELFSLTLSGAIAYAVVHEFGRQRELARAVEALFAADLHPEDVAAEVVELLPGAAAARAERSGR